MKLRHLDLFSGVGGFSLGLERTGGFETVAFCEIDPYCQKVLNKHWPDVPVHGDIHEFSSETVGPVDDAMEALEQQLEERLQMDTLDTRRVVGRIRDLIEVMLDERLGE